MSQTHWLLVLLALAVGFGVYRKVSDGKTRVDSHAVLLSSAEVGGDLGSKATLLQFSSAFCAPCRTTKQVLGKVAGIVPGVSHIELDAEMNLDLIRRLDVTRTPTTLILDANGTVRNRIVGVPNQNELLQVLAESI